MNLQPVFIREQIIKSVREFFYTLDFHEVIVPVLTSGLPVEPNIYAFETTWKTIYGDKKYYLSISPESGLKKMLGNGMGNCFAIGKCFRNLEDASLTHHPEFLMLEWYRKDAQYTDIMIDTTNLVRFIKKNVDTYLNRDPSLPLQYQGNTIDISSPWKTYSLVDLFREYAGLDTQSILNFEILKQKAEEKGYQTTNTNWGELYNQIFLNEIEPKLGINPCFLTDFPSSLSPLCTPKKDAPYLAERFEVYLAGMEIGNGNTENTNTKTIESVFINEQQYRQKHNILTPPIDTMFMKALSNMNDHTYGGIGLGIDRFAMIMADVTDIGLVEPLMTP